MSHNLYSYIEALGSNGNKHNQKIWSSVIDTLDALGILCIDKDKKKCQVIHNILSVAERLYRTIAIDCIAKNLIFLLKSNSKLKAVQQV